MAAVGQQSGGRLRSSALLLMRAAGLLTVDDCDESSTAGPPSAPSPPPPARTRKGACGWLPRWLGGGGEAPAESVGSSSSPATDAGGDAAAPAVRWDDKHGLVIRVLYPFAEGETMLTLSPDATVGELRRCAADSAPSLACKTDVCFRHDDKLYGAGHDHWELADLNISQESLIVVQPTALRAFRSSAAVRVNAWEESPLEVAVSRDESCSSGFEDYDSGMSLFQPPCRPGQRIAWEVAVHYRRGWEEALTVGVTTSPPDYMWLSTDRTEKWLHGNPCGWAWTDMGDVMVAGEPVEGQQYRAGDTLRIELDLAAGTLTFAKLEAGNNPGWQVELGVPADQTYFIFLGLPCPGAMGLRLTHHG
eukprot:TRINITY_DN65597_c0_g1_i1.p1 TRINITY_DN65597_c0_g1~~TRINITY_DN65597_c0_g1_i1.p1  ORF type:complete len:388 (+),score=126.86 TRINITY_DN65597_c0_g1_i1:79-1164(+)